MKVLPHLVSITLFFSLWLTGCLTLGERLIPWPTDVAVALAHILGLAEGWKHIGLTVIRGAAGLTLSLGLALLLGLPAGLNKRIMELTAPLVAAFQATPTILWITLLLVWIGTDGTMPVDVIILALTPPLFANIAQGAAALDRRILAMTALYQVNFRRTLKDVILPHLRPYLLAGMSYALGAVWRVAAAAEFFGASNGIGARIYWSFRMLDMPALFAWAFILVCFGAGLEMWMIRPLRRLADSRC